MRAWLIGLVIAAGLYALLVAALALLGRRTASREIAKLLPNLLALFRGLIRDPRVPRGSKAWLVFAAAWIASPIDLLPEFLPFLGPLDDAIVAGLVLRHLLKTADQDVVREHWRGDPGTLERLLRAFGAAPSAPDGPGRVEPSA